jgi:hypothetical protein
MGRLSEKRLKGLGAEVIQHEILGRESMISR